jgi:hypothetical protein
VDESLSEASRVTHFITRGRSPLRVNCAVRILREQLADPSQRAAAGRHSQTLWNTSALILFLLRRSARRFPRTVKVGACF